MMNDYHKKSDCGFAELLVSYLYDEIGSADKARFETHLESCAVCADELAGFGNVHFSINDWKLNEFAKLETPIAAIPYEKPAQTASQSSWLSALRDLFSLSPRGWTLATASATVLAIAALSAVLFLRAPQTVDVAGTNKQPKRETTAIVANTPEDGNANRQTEKTPDKMIAPINETSSPKTESAVQTENQNKRIVKVAGKTKTDNTKTPRTNGVKPENKNEQRKAPKVVGDEGEEDDTLRLAEIFDEIDTRD